MAKDPADYPGGEPRDGRFTDPVVAGADGEEVESIDDMLARAEAAEAVKKAEREFR